MSPISAAKMLSTSCMSGLDAAFLQLCIVSTCLTCEQNHIVKVFARLTSEIEFDETVVCRRAAARLYRDMRGEQPRVDTAGDG